MCHATVNAYLFSINVALVLEKYIFKPGIMCLLGLYLATGIAYRVNAGIEFCWPLSTTPWHR